MCEFTDYVGTRQNQYVTSDVRLRKTSDDMHIVIAGIAGCLLLLLSCILFRHFKSRMKRKDKLMSRHLSHAIHLKDDDGSDKRNMGSSVRRYLSHVIQLDAVAEERDRAIRRKQTKRVGDGLDDF